MNFRNYCLGAWLVAVAFAGSSAVLGACTSEESKGGEDGGDGGDARSLPDTDKPPVSDATTDSPVVVPVTDAEAGAPTFTAGLGTTGVFTILDQVFLGTVYEDDTIVRSPEIPECIAFARSATKSPSAAGNATLNGQYFGQDGGPPSTITVSPEPDGKSYALFLNPPEVLFPRTGALTVNFALAGVVPTVPPIPATTLASTEFDQVVVTAPVPPDGGDLVVKKSEPLEVRWQVPDAGGGANQKMIISLWFISSGAKISEIRCRYPFATGKAAIPSALLSEVRSRFTTANPVGGAILRVFAGDAKLFEPEGAAYVIEVSRQDSTTLGEISVTLD